MSAPGVTRDLGAVSYQPLAISYESEICWKTFALSERFQFERGEKSSSLSVIWRGADITKVTRLFRNGKTKASPQRTQRSRRNQGRKPFTTEARRTWRNADRKPFTTEARRNATKTFSPLRTQRAKRNEAEKPFNRENTEDTEEYRQKSNAPGLKPTGLHTSIHHAKAWCFHQHVFVRIAAARLFLGRGYYDEPGELTARR